MKGENPNAIHAALLLAVTGCRRSEIFALKWTEVDEYYSCFRFDDTKAGPQVRPVGSAAFEVLRDVKRQGKSIYVFPASRSNYAKKGCDIGGKGDPDDRGHLTGLKVIQEAFNKAKLGWVTPHGLRHAFASVGVELGYSNAVIGVLLGHGSNTVTERYMHVPDPAAMSAANRISMTIIRRMRGEDAGTIVEMSARRRAV